MKPTQVGETLFTHPEPGRSRVIDFFRKLPPVCFRALVEHNHRDDQTATRSTQIRELFLKLISALGWAPAVRQVVKALFTVC
jgi:hypothetical protein